MQLVDIYSTRQHQLFMITIIIRFSSFVFTNLTTSVLTLVSKVHLQVVVSLKYLRSLFWFQLQLSKHVSLPKIQYVQQSIVYIGLFNCMYFCNMLLFNNQIVIYIHTYTHYYASIIKQIYDIFICINLSFGLYQNYSKKQQSFVSYHQLSCKETNILLLTTVLHLIRLLHQENQQKHFPLIVLTNYQPVFLKRLFPTTIQELKQIRR
eukprot:TRINITY_DN16206_c0_g2_i1.p2 TRINITY_DN16206_c0_g2~~TRINITY_DN16206_c0_g2_i1.p2  ORF type:complete len:207 (-),score=-28.30 TRINITY_DN16206_c0_g2_i1:121-741(-)